jgi:Restriction endonuclease/Putative zinc-finger
MSRHPDFDHLIDYLYQALSPGHSAEVAAHIKSCERCREEQALSDALRAAAREEELGFPKLVGTSLEARLSGSPSALRAPLAKLISQLRISTLTSLGTRPDVDFRFGKLSYWNDADLVIASQITPFDCGIQPTGTPHEAVDGANDVFGPNEHYYAGVDMEPQPLIAAVTSANIKLLTLLKTRPDLVWQLDPRKFEELVAQILSIGGYDVTLTPSSNDGGYDIYAVTNAQLGRLQYLVECKRYVPPHKVGVETVRALYGVVQSTRATAGAIVTTSFFTAGAESFQKQVPNQISIHDYSMLQTWIADSVSREL